MRAMRQDTCQEIIRALEEAGNIKEIHAICCAICARYGFAHFDYVARLPTSLAMPYTCRLSGFPDDWGERRLESGCQQTDPANVRCMEKITPLTWNTAEPLQEENLLVRQIVSEARKCGQCCGVSLPAHGCFGETAMLSLASEEESTQARGRIREALPYLYLISAYLLEAIRRILVNEDISLRNTNLTMREKQCLLWAAEGKTSWETSQILRISERTVTFHLQNATRKLRAVNRQHAVARALSLSLIKPRLA